MSARGFLILLLTLSTAMAQPLPPWTKLPPIPDAEGFAGAFAGVSGDALLMAGGAHIVGEKWGETFSKRWYDSIYVLERPDGAWRLAGKLDAPLGYGVSVTARDALICMGGSDQEHHSTDLFELRYADGKVAITRTLPKLPGPLANSCGALVGDTIYLAGGLASPSATEALHIFWALDLSAPQPAWRELPPWPGPARMLSVAAAHGDAFYLFTGASLAAGPDGKPVRTYLRDAYRYTPAEGWKKLAELPRPAVAAPTPAIEAGPSSFLIVSGDDGLNVNFTPVKEHPGFPRNILAYDRRADRWTVAGEVPFSMATAPCVAWRGHEVIPNGEIRPRVRTNEVWSMRIP